MSLSSYAASVSVFMCHFVSLSWYELKDRKELFFYGLKLFRGLSQEQNLKHDLWSQKAIKS